MRINDYKMFGQGDRLRYIRSQKMTTGIPYFGGKAKIGKYIFNVIFNMAVYMKDKGTTPEMFIDVCTGGGKMALSVPNGWFKTIVMNDYDYGVYSYYKAAKDNHKELIATIDYLIDNMSEFNFYLYIKIRESEDLNYVMAGAMTYLVAALSFNNMTAEDNANYKPSMGDNVEKVELEKARNRAHRTIQKVHKKLNSQHYIIENLSYEQLIAKYNGLSWHEKDRVTDTGINKGRKEKTIKGEVHEPIIEYKAIKDNILWYLDPPYISYCLAGLDDAPYANSFDIEETRKMTKILSGEDTTYGELKHFIKSDYNPKEKINEAKEKIIILKNIADSDKTEPEKAFYKQWEPIINEKDDSIKLRIQNIKSKAVLDSSDKAYLKRWEDLINGAQGTIKSDMEHIFDNIEKFPFIAFSVGGFDKGAIIEDGTKSIGDEWVWCRGLPEYYLKLKEED